MRRRQVHIRLDQHGRDDRWVTCDISAALHCPTVSGSRTLYVSLRHDNGCIRSQSGRHTSRAVTEVADEFHTSVHAFLGHSSTPHSARRSIIVSTVCSSTSLQTGLTSSSCPGKSVRHGSVLWSATSPATRLTICLTMSLSDRQPEMPVPRSIVSTVTARNVGWKTNRGLSYINLRTHLCHSNGGLPPTEGPSGVQCFDGYHHTSM